MDLKILSAVLIDNEKNIAFPSLAIYFMRGQSGHTWIVEVFIAYSNRQSTANFSGSLQSLIYDTMLQHGKLQPKCKYKYTTD